METLKSCQGYHLILDSSKSYIYRKIENTKNPSNPNRVENNKEPINKEDLF